MSKNVFFMDMRSTSPSENKLAKIKKLLSQYSDKISDKDLTAIKIHFGEIGNDSFINPIFVREVVNYIKSFGGNPFVTDTNTLYSGSRHNAVDHLKTATLHGFVPSVIDAPVIIADGLKGDHFKVVKLPTSETRLSSYKIAGDIFNADSMIVMSHFKAHEMAGFGGAIKNLAMGCAPAAGKKDQHSTKQFVYHDKCIGCGTCARICPVNAISIDYNKANINSDICLGCGECMANCPAHAVGINWDTEITEFVERLTEYAYAAVVNKMNKVIYLNFLTNIVPDCDCCGMSDAPIVPDIGFLVSDDPVAIDKASLDLVNSQQGFVNSKLTSNFNPGEDKFKGVRSFTIGEHQIQYGEKIGLGSGEYNLIKL